MAGTDTSTAAGTDADTAAGTRDDVTVVGGGLAGMTAAWTLRRLGLPVRLLEASPNSAAWPAPG